MDREIYCGTIIDKEAKIILLNSHQNLHSFSSQLKGKIDGQIDLLCGLWWSIEGLKQVVKLLFIILRNKFKFPNIRVTILCNTLKEHKLLKLLNIRSIYCNHNCFIDYNLFNIDYNVKKIYSAVYNAVLSDYKRHLLCSGIPDLALVTYNFKNFRYKKLLDTVLEKPTWLNYKVNSEPRLLNTEEIIKIYNEANCGLALSKIEGAMYSSTEYLLCGLPVVSTSSTGGRHIFYTSNNSIITNANTKDIGEAVKFWNDNVVDRDLIRAECISVMESHRKVFTNYINSLFIEKGFRKNVEDTWDSWYVNKLRNDFYIEDFIRELKD